ncbi:MAG: hypothetical protein KJO69_08770 [Gammaproteobacteria bacterium]|nr:hypothetical protein [Gammaproteobacteria bacterium]
MNTLLQQVQVTLSNGTQIEAIAYIDAVANFCMGERYKDVFENWDFEIVRTIVAYHLAKNTITVIQKDGVIEGVHMWYHCNKDDDWSLVEEWREDDPNGDAIFMAFLFSEDTVTFKKIVLDLLSREPSVLHKHLIGLRKKSGKPTKVKYTPKLFTKILKL